MNFIYLKGIIKNIKYSHSIGDIVFNKAEIISRRKDGREDLITIKYKQFSADCKENDEVELVGNIRSFSRSSDGKNKVDIYVFSYFDDIDQNNEQYDCNNVAKLSGRICKKDTIRTTHNGKHYIHFILANNLITENEKRLNSYIPCVAWGTLAKLIDSEYEVGSQISVDGQLQSREYKKRTDDGIELRLAHEFAVLSIGKDDEL